MLKVDIPSIKIEFYFKDILYKVNYDNEVLNIREELLPFIYEVTMSKDEVKFYKYNIVNGIKDIVLNKEKNDLIKRINYAISNSNLVSSVIDLDKFNYNIKNILLSNGNIALCNISIKSINNYSYIDILLLESKDIIGSIKINNDEILVNVDSIYLDETLKLVKGFVSLFKNKKEYKIKTLKL